MEIENIFNTLFIPTTMSNLTLRSKKLADLKSKKILFAMWDCENKSAHAYQNWYLGLKRIFGKVILFDPKARRYEYGREGMKNRFFDIIRKEKPDFAWLAIGTDEINPATLREINKISPKTITLSYYGDDDTMFENFTRYYALFLDYALLSQPQYIKEFNKDGRYNVYPSIGENVADYKLPEMKKEHEVTFIGIPWPESRVEWIRYLVKEGIPIKVWGKGWDKYPDLKDCYGGVLKAEDYFKALGSSKISLNFSRNRDDVLHIKGRVFELAVAKCFFITEHFEEYLRYFKTGKEIISFKTKKELVDKIRYYLKNDKKREQVASNAYKKALKVADIETEVGSILLDILEKGLPDRKLPELSKKIVTISNSDLVSLSERELADKVKVADYVAFTDKKAELMPYKEYLQAYSLSRTQKDISCCEYYIHLAGVGDYLTSKSADLSRLKRPDLLHDVLNLNAIMVQKAFFLRSIQMFKEKAAGKNIQFMTPENTAYITMPLVRVGNRPNIDYNTIKDAFELNFLIDIKSLMQRKKFGDAYFYKLALSSLLTGNLLPLKILKEQVKKQKLIEAVKNKMPWRNL